MKPMAMFTIANAYQPMRAGRCTVRKLSDKYILLEVGDRIHMSYWTGVFEGNPQGECLAREVFAVARLVFGSAKDVMPEIWQDNHAQPRAEDRLWKALSDAYGGDFGPNTQIVAIYA